VSSHPALYSQHLQRWPDNILLFKFIVISHPVLFNIQHLQRWPDNILLFRFIVTVSLFSHHNHCWPASNRAVQVIVGSSPTQFINIEPNVLTRLPFQSRHLAHRY
jgi:hypothetical protein